MVLIDNVNDFADVIERIMTTDDEKEKDILLDNVIETLDADLFITNCKELERILDLVEKLKRF